MITFFNRGLLLLTLSLPLPLLVATGAMALPCNGEAVYTGDTKEQVAAKCGEAALKEQRVVVEEVTEKKKIRRSTTTIDEWTYDRGPEELVLTYRFENGKVADIRGNGYGSVRDFSIDNCRNGETLAVGETTIEAYLKCGEPIAKEKMKDKVVESEDDGKLVRTFLPVTEWTYRYGPTLPGYTVTFENGVAAQIRTREFGK